MSPPSQNAPQSAAAADNTVAPANLYPRILIDLIQNPSRFYALPILGILIKTIILLPVFLYLGILSLGLSIGAIVNSFVVLLTGRYWKAAYQFNLGWFRLLAKVSFFLSGVTNKYPGFSRQLNDSFSLDLEYPEKSSRFFAVPFLGGTVRILLLIPFFIYSYVIQNAAYIGVFLFSWPYVLIRGRYPESTFELTRDQTRLNLALYAYVLGLSDKYPSFRISMHHKIKKLFLISIASILLILSNAFPYLLNSGFRDAPPIDDGDLQLKTVALPQTQNAFYDLVEAGKYVYEPDKGIKDYLEGKKWDETLIQETLAKNEQALALFDEAAKKPKFQDPKTADPVKIFSEFDNPSFKLNPLESLKIARISSLKAISLLRQGKEIEAFNEVIKSVEIGQKIQESQVSLIDYLVAVAMKGIGLETMQKIITTSKLPPEILIQDATYLEKFKNNEEGLKVALKAEYLSFSQTIDAVTMGETDALNLFRDEGKKIDPETFKKIPKASFYFQPNKTKAIFANSFRAGINTAGKSCGQIKEGEIKKLSPFPSSSTISGVLKMTFAENSLGRTLHDVLFNALNLSAQNDKRCQEDFLVSATQLFFALKAYNLEAQNIPASLDQLVPRYISRVPEDPFDGKPIRYSPSKMIIYSIGKDGVDSGGSEGEEWLTMPDPTFKVNFMAPPLP